MAKDETGDKCEIKPEEEIEKAEERKDPVKYGSREEAMDLMLDKLEQHLIDKDMKGTVADYLRLIQVRREIADERPKEIEITWVNSLGEESSDGE